MKNKLLIFAILLICLACGKSYGHFGEPCGEGGDCSSGLECNDENICEQCGDDGELCCQSGLLKTGCSMGECGQDGRCRKCGSENEACCSDGSCWQTAGQNHLTCGPENTCILCGKNEQPCCEYGCDGIACGSDNICHDEICEDAGICQPCGDLEQACCIGNTCKKDRACGAEGVCLNCGSMDELVCQDNACDGWYMVFDGYCRIPFAALPETGTEICKQSQETDIRKREHADWCYWYAAYYKHDASLCNRISMGQMKNPCTKGENPDDYFVIITTE